MFAKQKSKQDGRDDVSLVEGGVATQGQALW